MSPTLRWTAAWTALLLTPLAWTQAAMQRPQPDQIELTGSVGKGAWKIRYGSMASVESRFAPAGADRAWFSHGSWLRLIDTGKGTVVGRWRMPGIVQGLTPAAGKVEVQFDLEKQAEREFREKLTFDPAAPSVPNWPQGWLLPMRVSRVEPAGVAEKRLVDISSSKSEITVEAAKQAIPALEEAVRRDPWAPWLRVALSRMLRAAGDTRAEGVLREAIELPSADYTDLLPLAALLDSVNQPDAARAAFDKGYADFLRRGNDPRLLSSLIGRIILYQPAETVGTRPEVMERLYRIGPGAEGATLAWKAYAMQLEREGKTEEAGRWEARAARREESLAPFDPETGFGIATDQALLAIMALFFAIPLYWLVLYRRYLPQRRADRGSQQPTGLVGARLGFTNVQYWRRSERFAFITLVAAAWMMTGLAAIFSQGILRVAASPVGLGLGSFAGPVNLWYLENKLPALPERDLLLAMAHQHSGDAAKAEQIYRRVPQFAEGWNNLGVILKNAGKQEEARQAFEQALRIDPAMAEAALNLGRAPSDEWTRLYQESVPGRPMMATPRRPQLIRAFLGSSRSRAWVQALAGPFAVPDAAGLITLVSDGGSVSSIVASRILLALLVLSLALLLLVPMRDVSQPPGARHWIWEVIAPGTSPAWSVLGGLVLLAWCYFLVQGLLTWRFGSPYLMSMIALPNLSRSYLVQGAFTVAHQAIIPGWQWLYLAPAVLFLVNLVVVRRSRRATT